jgi:hypothetical protein
MLLSRSVSKVGSADVAPVAESTARPDALSTDKAPTSATRQAAGAEAALGGRSPGPFLAGAAPLRSVARYVRFGRTARRTMGRTGVVLFHWRRSTTSNPASSNIPTVPLYAAAAEIRPLVSAG